VRELHMIDGFESDGDREYGLYTERDKPLMTNLDHNYNEVD
jgi:hypothetical protein